jgi:hypothetical protein
MLIDVSLNSQQLAKNHITIIFEDKESRVSWWADTPIEEARFSIICACDSLVDGEFEVLDEKAKPIDLNTITLFKTGSVFFLRKKNTGKPTNILLDGRRKLYVQIEPLRHIESQVAVKYMLIGSNLLKHTKKGFPHIRLFQLSSDFKRVLWYTKSKKIDQAQVSIDTIKEISLGQQSENFIRYPLKMLEDFSFSIYYTGKGGENLTLDLTCKDEREYDLWIIGIKALLAHYHGKIISKNDLLQHSKSYKEQVERGNIGSSTKFLFYKKDQGVNTQKGKSLENFIVSRNLSLFEIGKLIVKLCLRVKTLRDDVEVQSGIDEYKTGQKMEGYDMVFAEEAIADDLDTQKSQMIILFRECERNLSLFAQEYLLFIRENNKTTNIHEDDADDFIKNIHQIETHCETHLSKVDSIDQDVIKSEFFLKELDIQLWKIEVDLENVGDIINRFKAPQNTGFMQSIKKFFKLA